MAGFKDLQVWQKGIDLVELVYGVCSQLPSNEQYGLCSQMKRAVVSIPSNIAEGYRRNNKKEFHHFCGIALGSAAELETQLIITKRVYPETSVDVALDLNDEVQRMLSSLIKTLKPKK